MGADFQNDRIKLYRRFDPLPGEFSTHLYIHEFPREFYPDPFLCCTYITEGLARLAGCELVFTWRKPSDEPVEAFLADPLQRFLSMYKLALPENQHLGGIQIGVGAFIEFKSELFMGGHLTYIPLQNIGIPLPHNALTALWVTGNEGFGISDFGISRFMTRMANIHRYYPCPPWSTHQRPEISYDEQMRRESALYLQTPHVNLPWMYVSQVENHLRIRIAASGLGVLQRILGQLPAEQPFVVYTGIDPWAERCLVWEPGAKEPMAVMRSSNAPETISGCSIFFVTEQPATRFNWFQDGFALFLTTADWATLRNAMQTGAAFALPAGVVLEWYGS